MRLISVGILTRNGGDGFRAVLDVLARQVCPVPHQVVILDSGSTDGTPEAAAEAGAVVHRIRPEDFSFGESRDLLFSRCEGEIIATISQDARPAGVHWLERITRPIREGRADVVQGMELLDDKTFYWERIGRFYSTSEWRPFFERYGWPGLPGLSTVNLAVSRRAWEATGFGPIPMCSDKLFQKRAVQAGLRVEACREAAVHHSHHYTIRSLFKRCANEGMALRLLGISVGTGQTLRDVLNRKNHRALVRGLLRGEVRRPAEVLFPLLRPLGIWYGYRFVAGYWH
ncbi:glycosyltransferase [Rhodocaloribacter litoris]|uniref:glycosyltransferase family 2 protein n=1 Tax=Rhodocaloribacter litoris TaxID=2558931 RepID=UPI00142472BA|nr:glycosyltransferase [Rhodocaloribacter litoris]QXD16147.1 glycosyltransferase [Rhodocaloribacter litoris]